MQESLPSSCSHPSPLPSSPRRGRALHLPTLKKPQHTVDQHTSQRRRHHLHETVLRRAVREAAQAIGGEDECKGATAGEGSSRIAGASRALDNGAKGDQRAGGDRRRIGTGRIRQVCLSQRAPGVAVCGLRGIWREWGASIGSP